MLWIDGVGGYLVCLADCVSIGRAFGSPVDIPLVADLSREHATVARSGEGYVLTPLGPVYREGRPLEHPVLLSDGDVLRLGSSVDIRFRQPSPLSRTARLELVSRHRPNPSADGILLMGETCILGPSSQSHVVCPHWRDPVVLLRTSQGLGCRHAGPLTVDGSSRSGRVELTGMARVCGPDFCFSLEPLK
jgi:hypothetical protein